MGNEALNSQACYIHSMLTKFLALIFLEFLPLHYLKLIVVARLGPVTLMRFLCSDDCSVFLSNELEIHQTHGF